VYKGVRRLTQPCPRLTKSGFGCCGRGPGLARMSLWCSSTSLALARWTFAQTPPTSPAGGFKKKKRKRKKRTKRRLKKKDERTFCSNTRTLLTGTGRHAAWCCAQTARNSAGFAAFSHHSFFIFFCFLIVSSSSFFCFTTTTISRPLHQLSASEAKLVLSALSVAVTNAGCEVPVFAQVPFEAPGNGSFDRQFEILFRCFLFFSYLL
jgi:hypothetical protein